jgi:hypothetical protein
MKVQEMFMQATAKQVDSLPKSCEQKQGSAVR